MIEMTLVYNGIVITNGKITVVEHHERGFFDWWIVSGFGWMV